MNRLKAMLVCPHGQRCHQLKLVAGTKRVWDNAIMRVRATFVVIFVLSCCNLAGAGEPSPVYLASGESFPATAVASTNGGKIHFTTPEGEKVVAASDFVKWGELSDSWQGLQVLLADGSVLVASDVRIAEEKLVVEANLFGEPEDLKLQGTLRLPLEAVRGVLLRVPIDPLARDRQLAQVWRATGNADQLLLVNGDAMSGTLKKLAPLAGDDDQPGPLAATLETLAGEVTIAPDNVDGRLSDKVAAIIFNPQLAPAPPPAARQLVVGFADGSRLLATRVDADEEQATFHTGAAKIASHPDENIWSQITSLQTLGGDVKYLSELAPKGYRHLPLVGPAWPLGIDENALGGKLRSGERFYLRGIGMHAASAVVFQLDRPYAKLQGELALDVSAGDRGSVYFVVLADAGGKLVPIHKSAVIRGGDAPTPISLDITGAKRVGLIVEPADHGDALDRANWLDVRLLP